MTARAHGDIPAELAEILAGIVGPDGSFRHREHVHLAFIAVRRYGTAGATAKISGWIRHIARYERAPQRYHATVTRAWTELVGHHVAATPLLADFAAFADLHPQLLDKRLLMRHYAPATLASATARTGWVGPDLAPFPWQPPAQA